MKISHGILITIEGIDGAGKSTLAHQLTTALQEQNYAVVLTKEPGATPLGKQVRTLVHQKEYTRDSKAEFLLFAADRAQHIRDIVAPALAQHKIVISDRFADSSCAYQGFGRGLDISMITLINQWVLNGHVPDVTFYLKIDPQIAYERICKRQEVLTSFEGEQRVFFERVVYGFEEIFRQRTNVISLDALLPTEILCEQALHVLRPLLTKGT